MGPGDQIQIEVWLYWGNFVILMLESIGDSNSSSAEINIWSEGKVFGTWASQREAKEWLTGGLGVGIMVLVDGPFTRIQPVP